jgi:hypothetical protein
MNWFRRQKIASLSKVAYPYSTNLCPNCSTSLLLDFYWEKHNRNIGLGIGKCPKCHTSIKAELLPYRKVENKEESVGFRFSTLSVLPSSQFVHLQHQGTPEILITEDEENIATQRPESEERSPIVDIPDPMEGEEGNANMPVAASARPKLK